MYYSHYIRIIIQLSRLTRPLSKVETGHGVLSNSPFIYEISISFFGNFIDWLNRYLAYDLRIIRAESISAKAV
jgi:hypothetical protein